MKIYIPLDDTSIQCCLNCEFTTSSTFTFLWLYIFNLCVIVLNVNVSGSISTSSYEKITVLNIKNKAFRKNLQAQFR